MHTLQTNRLKSSRTEMVAENGNNHPRQPSVGHASDDGLALAAEPSYDREYNHLLTLKEAVDR